jgi:CRISPR-associated protein Csm4
MRKFVEAAQREEFLISDLFPWAGEELYLPKPVLPLFFQRDRDEEVKRDKKLMKCLTYLPVSKFREYLDFLRNGGVLPWTPDEFDLACEILLYRANIAREDKTMLYPVLAFRFQENSGLYFVVQTREEWREKLDLVIESLGMSGIGGKKSSGLGKFEMAEESFEVGLYDSDCILEELLGEEGGFYMSLSVLAPTREELAVIKEGKSYYSLLKRTGFVASPAYAANYLKRKPVVMFDAGSCYTEKIRGQILDVGEHGGHQVYRYGKGMYLGVKI